ncbi:alpha/beta fold hydrolase [Phenylobacterium aquaticum]|uniref:alpha/beta fold hydrolase n=1 Tax=Phenylobacterium aquaticum TaxID=1763816 RepID=UPI0026F34C3C|nr:alpha/beta hydrolase [Phenylobacterium aquaticum]
MNKSLRALVLALAALTLGACAKDIPYATLKAKYTTSASRFVELPGGVDVHYRDQGNPAGSPIILVHGFAANLDTWEPWVKRLGPNHRVVTLDLAAHGLTTVPAGYKLSNEGQVAIVDGVAQTLKLDHFALAGNSMGGGVAWAYTLAHPDKVSALILVDSAGAPVDPAAMKKKGGPPIVFVLLRNPLGRALLRQINPRPLAEKGLKQAYIDQSLVTPQLVDRYVELALAPGHRDLLLNAQGGPRKPATAETFKAIHAPTLVMHGEADTVIPVAAGKALAAAIPGAKLILYPGVGHVPMEQIPDKSAADLEAFLATVPAVAK